MKGVPLRTMEPFTGLGESRVLTSVSREGGEALHFADLIDEDDLIRLRRNGNLIKGVQVDSTSPHLDPAKLGIIHAAPATAGCQFKGRTANPSRPYSPRSRRAFSLKMRSFSSFFKGRVFHQSICGPGSAVLG